MVSGIIGATQNNSEGIAGIAGTAVIMPLIACDVKGVCDPHAIARAIQYAVDNGARVINLSLGSNETSDYDTEFDAPLQNAWNKGIVVVAAAGNSDIHNTPINTSLYKMSPICNETAPNMILGVGASDSTNTKRTNWSNYGSCVDIYAPGENIFSTSIPNTTTKFLYAAEDGTSFATPIIAGLAADILATYPTMSNAAVWQYITQNTDNGMVNAKKIADAIISTYDPTKDTGNIWHGTTPSITTTSTAPATAPAPALTPATSTPPDPLAAVFIADAATSQFASSILDLKARGIIHGYPDGTFHPFDPINRAEFMAIVMNASKKKITGDSCFDDVGTDWYAGYICGAWMVGIVNGYPDHTFHPDNNITVAEALKITFNAFSTRIRKADKKESWYAPLVEYAEAHNTYLFTWTDPNQTLTREEMAELIDRIVTKKK